jgi:hypothetical protein
LWSLRILRNESNLANDRENENDSKFGGATPHRRLTTDNFPGTVAGCQRDCKRLLAFG